MITFLQYLAEGNPLLKVHKALAKGHPVGTISPETKNTTTRATRKAAHKAIQADLRRLSDKGLLSFSGPHKGQYRYDADAEPSKEGSYVLKPGNHPKARHQFHRIITRLGRKYDQESILKVRKKSEGQQPTGALHITKGNRLGKSDSLGKIHYNQPLGKGEGNTQFKGKSASFTVKP